MVSLLEFHKKNGLWLMVFLTVVFVAFSICEAVANASFAAFSPIIVVAIVWVVFLVGNKRAWQRTQRYRR